MGDAAFEISTAPYPGLRPFRVTESDIFFGREKQTDQLLQRLSVHRFLAVTGPSGCGKSSLVRAGMLPALNAGFLAAAGSRWRVCQMRPGDRPLGRLSGCLAQPDVLGEERCGPEALPWVEAALRRGPLGLAELVGECPALRGTNLLVLVDQFEEIFRYRETSNPDEADAFVELLLSSALRSDLPIYVVITMRSDYLGDCALFHGLPEAINGGQYLTPRLTREECRSSIVGPAKVFGGEVDELLVNRLLNDFGPDPDQLPLLQHALMRMWSRGVGGAKGADAIRITGADYEAVGGMARALSSHADEALGELDPGQQQIAQVMFRRLTERQQGKRDTRAPAHLSEVAAIAGVSAGEVAKVVEVFRSKGRSFIAESEDQLLDISHESLIRQWGALAEWVEEEAESAALYRRLCEDARRWKRGDADLWGERNLAQAIPWREREKPTAAWARRYSAEEDFKGAMGFLRDSERLVEGRRRARRIRWLGLTAFFALLAAGVSTFVAVYASWYVQPSVSYYADFVKVWGVPRGVGKPLTLDEVRHRNASYEFTRNGSKGEVKQVRAVDASLQPTRNHGYETYFTHREQQRLADVPVRWEYELEGDGLAMHEIAYGKDGDIVWVFIYFPSAHPRLERDGTYLGPDGLPRADQRFIAHIQYSPAGLESRIFYRNRLGKAVKALNGAFGAELVYDDRGRMTDQWSLGPDGKRMNDDYGNSGLHMEVDDRGNITDRVVLDTQGRITTVKERWSRAHEVYDAFGRSIERSYYDAAGKPVPQVEDNHRVTMRYDDRGLLSWIAYFDEGGHPGPSLKDGCYARAYEWDARGNNTRVVCQGPDGRPGPDKEGVVSTSVRFDQAGNVTEVATYGGNGAMIPGREGHSRVQYVYGENGLVQEKYFDATGAMTANSRGFARVDMTRDRRGNATSTAYFDARGKPFMIARGYSTITQERDETGEVTLERYFGPDGKPVLSVEGYASLRARFDAQGNRTEVALAGIDGRPRLGKDHHAGQRFDYDDFGRLTGVTNVGLQGQPVRDINGVVSWRNRFNSLGQEEEEAYFGEDGSPATHRRGYSRVTSEYDEHGYETRRSYYDRRGRLVAVHPDEQDEKALHGFATVRYRYTPRGERAEAAYFDARGHLVLVDDGYARTVDVYDDRGNNTETEYFGAQNEKVLLKTGYHHVRRTFDARGNAIEIRYYGVDEKLLRSAEGFARIVRKFDAYDRLVEDRVFDERDGPVLTVWGAHRSKYRYDPRGRRSDELFFGLNGPMAVQGCFSWHKKYDDWGNVIEERCLGSGGELVKHESSGCAVITHRYDPFSRPVELTCLGTDGRPAVRKIFRYNSSGALQRAETIGVDAPQASAN